MMTTTDTTRNDSATGDPRVEAVERLIKCAHENVLEDFWLRTAAVDVIGLLCRDTDDRVIAMVPDKEKLSIESNPSASSDRGSMEDALREIVELIRREPANPFLADNMARVAIAALASHPTPPMGLQELEALTAPIKASEVRLHAGEGRLPSWAVIDAVNIILRNRRDAWSSGALRQGTVVPDGDTIAVPKALLHALWCYGNLRPVVSVVYGHGTHEKCLDEADRLLFNAAMLSASPSVGSIDVVAPLESGRERELHQTIERIIFRRIIANEIDGLTIATATEIKDAVLAFLNPSPADVVAKSEGELAKRLRDYMPGLYPAHGSGYVALFGAEARHLMDAAADALELRALASIEPTPLGKDGIDVGGQQTSTPCAADGNAQSDGISDVPRSPPENAR